MGFGGELTGKTPVLGLFTTPIADTTEPAPLVVLPRDTSDPVIKRAVVDTVDTEEPKKAAAQPIVPKPAPVTNTLEAIEDEDEEESTSVYGDFDTTIVHVGKFDALHFNDTVTLVLNDPAHCAYAHPFNGVPTSQFGFRKYRYHFGVDINLETGDTVKSCFDGKVRIAQYSKTYGFVVVVRHNNGLETYYAHLSKLEVKPNQDIEAGQMLGLGGNTGHSHGSHLHFEVRYGGIAIDPSMIIDFNKRCLRADTYNLTKSNFKYLSETHKIVRRSRKSKRTRVSYYTPGGATYATAEAKAIMAKVPAPVAAGDVAPANTAAPANCEPEKKEVPQAKAPSPTTKKPATTGAKTYHTVRKGDTLSAIAARYGTSVNKICQLNGIKSTTTLQIGKKLRVK